MGYNTKPAYKKNFPLDFQPTENILRIQFYYGHGRTHTHTYIHKYNIHPSSHKTKAEAQCHLKIWYNQKLDETKFSTIECEIAMFNKSISLSLSLLILTFLSLYIIINKIYIHAFIRCHERLLLVKIMQVLGIVNCSKTREIY